PRNGSRAAIRGSSTTERPPTQSASAARWNISAAMTRPRALSGIRPSAWWRGRTTRRPPAGAVPQPTSFRFWPGARPPPVKLPAFNRGDYVGAMTGRAQSEAISRFLYPNDSTPEGQELRLRQEYFFTSASLQDLVRRHLDEFGMLDNLAEQAAVQLNDTH